MNPPGDPVILGTVIGALVSWFAGSLDWIGTIIMIIVWLALIKHFFDCGWIKAFIIAVIAVIIFVVIVVILAAILVLIGIGISITPWF